MGHKGTSEGLACGHDSITQNQFDQSQCKTLRAKTMVFEDWFFSLVSTMSFLRLPNDPTDPISGSAERDPPGSELDRFAHPVRATKEVRRGSGPHENKEIVRLRLQVGDMGPNKFGVANKTNVYVDS